jgi:hypothetical protein
LTLGVSDHRLQVNGRIEVDIVVFKRAKKEALNMAIWDFRPRGDVWTGVAVGAGLLAAPVVLPLAWCATRPVLKAFLKGGFMLYETGRQILGETSEGTQSRQARAQVAKQPASPRRTRTSGEEEEELIGKIRTAEEQAIGGKPKPKPRAPKQRKKVDTKK